MDLRHNTLDELETEALWNLGGMSMKIRLGTMCLSGAKIGNGEWKRLWIDVLEGEDGY